MDYNASNVKDMVIVHVVAYIIALLNKINRANHEYINVNLMYILFEYEVCLNGIYIKVKLNNFYTG